jgi:UDP-3-O-[3-hydroxymyristoyl] glucosamine N-acyltransferase
VRRGAAKSASRKRGAGPARRDRSPFTLAELAAAVSGLVDGDPGFSLTGVQPLDRAGPADLSWVADERRAGEAGRSGAGALLVAKAEQAGGRPAVVAANPTAALAVWLERWAPAQGLRPGVARGAHVEKTARLGRGVSVAAGATVSAGARVGARTSLWPGAFIGEGAEVGEDCVLAPNAAVLARCRIGDRCILYAGAIVGSDGFGYVWDGERHRKIPQIGIVRLEDDVEVGANSTIDRATLGETVVRRGTKIDNLVMIAHNVEVGAHSILCGQVGVAGSTRIGQGVTLAGQAGIGDHAEIGDRAIVTAQGGVVTRGQIPPGAVVSGMPAAPHRQFLGSAAVLRRLPELARRFEALEKRVEALAKGGGPWNSESSKS